MNQFDPKAVDFAKMPHGLVPCIVQDERNMNILMLGYMNEEALAATLKTETVTFFSRSKQRLWVKGETSGNVLKLKKILADCDQDAILVLASPKGPTCHLGGRSCFSADEVEPFSFLGDLSSLIHERSQTLPPQSYTTSLFKAGTSRMAQKVGEEGVEVALASKDDDGEAFLGECADLVFHMMVLARHKGYDLSDIAALLKKRHEG